jgi:hypothetical protein
MNTNSQGMTKSARATRIDALCSMRMTQSGPSLSFASPRELAIALDQVRCLHDMSAELIAECVFESMRTQP